MSEKDRELFELRQKKEQEWKEREEDRRESDKRDTPKDWKSLYNKLRYEDSPEASIEDKEQDRENIFL